MFAQEDYAKEGVATIKQAKLNVHTILTPCPPISSAWWYGIQSMEPEWQDINSDTPIRSMFFRRDGTGHTFIRIIH